MPRGRPAKPLALHLHDGKKHLTTTEIKEREDGEIRFGTRKFTLPCWLRTDRIARAKWNEITALYESSGLELASSADVGAIARYCKAWSEYRDLLRQREMVADVEFDPDAADEELDDAGITKARRARLIAKLEYLASLGGLLTVDSAINKKMDQILKLEDRLFLNPLAKVRNVPKPSKKDPAADPLGQAGFGGI
jgi:phage terminase small subunit